MSNPGYSDKQLILGIWKREKKAYVVMVNNWPAHRDISLTLEPHVIIGELKPIFSTRYIPNLKVDNGKLSPHVLPWEAFIWETSE